MSNPLRIASIKKDSTSEEAKILWEQILKPKWKAKNKREAEKWIESKLKKTV